MAGVALVLDGDGKALTKDEGPVQLYVYGSVPALTDDVSESVPVEQYFEAVLPADTIGSGLTVTATVPGTVDTHPFTV